MADYKAIYQQKLKTAAQVAQMVESGWVFGMDAAPTQADVGRLSLPGPGG